MQPDQRFHRLGAVNCLVRPPAAARGARDILLPRTLEGAILASNPPGIRGMSVKMSLLPISASSATRQNLHLRQ
jgi:hypothetical protein